MELRRIVVSEVLGFVEKRHAFGLLATSTGFGVWVLSVLKVISVVAGAGGAIFGLVAGFYTMRSAIRNYKSGK